MKINKNYKNRKPQNGATFSKCYNIPVRKIKTAHKTNQTENPRANVRTFTVRAPACFKI